MERSPVGRLHQALTALNSSPVMLPERPMELPLGKRRVWLMEGPSPLLAFGRGDACVFPESVSKPAWIPAGNINLQQGSRRETPRPMRTCAWSHTTQLQTIDYPSPREQPTEDEEPGSQQPGGHLGRGEKDAADP